MICTHRAGERPSEPQGLGKVRACLVGDDGVSESGGSGAGAAAGDDEGAKVGVHGACLEVDVAFATPIPDTIVARVTSGHPRLGLGLIIEGVFLGRQLC